jgi:hypothetical protein
MSRNVKHKEFFKNVINYDSEYMIDFFTATEAILYNKKVDNRDYCNSDEFKKNYIN